MNFVYMFGQEGIRKSNPNAAYSLGNRILKLTSNFTSIIGSQHDYFFIPTTELQIII